MMDGKRQFEVTLRITAIVEIDESLERILPEFGEYMWHADRLEDIAVHIVWNRVYRKFNHVEGLSEEDHALFKVFVDEEEIDDVRELTGNQMVNEEFPSTWYGGRRLN